MIYMYVIGFHFVLKNELLKSPIAMKNKPHE